MTEFFKETIVVHQDPWKREVFDGRYLVETRRETQITVSGIVCGVQVSKLYDLEHEDQLPPVGTPIELNPGNIFTVDSDTVSKIKIDRDTLLALNKAQDIFHFKESGKAPPYAVELVIDDESDDRELRAKNLSEMISKHASARPIPTFTASQKYYIRSDAIPDAIPAEFRPQIQTIKLDGHLGSISLGNFGKDGELSIQNQQRKNVFLARCDPNNHGGQLLLKDKNGELTVVLRGDNADMSLGSSGQDGNLQLKNKAGVIVVNVIASNNEQGGHLVLRDQNGKDTVSLNGNSGAVSVGAHGHDGAIYLKDSNDIRTLCLEGSTGKITAGLEEVGGVIEVLKSKSAGTRYGRPFRTNQKNSRAILLDGDHGNIIVGGEGIHGNISVCNDKDEPTVHIEGQTGDIILSNADCAEEFDIHEEDIEVDPGTVMVLNESGQLTVSGEAYDKKVAGIISGAGDYKPGIVLDRQPSPHKRMPVALMGKVFCKVDAAFGPIEVGDLLTTSPTSGHAMKVNDPLKAFGAVIGKALRELKDGQGLIPVLVSLQ